MDLAQILISSSTPNGAPLCQGWWKSTQGFLRYRVYEVKIAYLDQVHWPLTLGGSRPKSNQFIYSSWCTPVPSLMKIHQGVLEISCLRGKTSIFRPSSIDLWRWADLAQNLISSSTPHGAPLCQVWWQSTHGFLIYCVYEVKIAYLDQVSSYTPHGAPLCQVWWKSTKGFLRYRVYDSIFRPSLLTFDLWRWADLAQNLISSSTPHGASLGQVW